MNHSINESDPISIEIPNGPDIKLNMNTVIDAIHVATIVSFDEWMDKTNASGIWPEGTNDQSEKDYYLLDSSKTPLDLKFTTAIRVFYQKGIIIYTI